MVKLYQRHLASAVIKTALIALVVVLSLDLLINLIRELDDVGQGQYTYLTALYYLLLTLPRRLYEALPAALLIGGLLGLGSLARDNELTILRTSGLSRRRLTGAALLGGLSLSLLGFAIGEFVVPATERQAILLRSEARTDYITIGGRRGFWARDRQYFINIRAVQSGFRLVDIFIYEVGDNANLISVTHAKSARYDQRGHWLLENVSRSLLRPDLVAISAPPAITWSSVITPEMLGVLALPPLNLSLRDLVTYIAYLKGNGLDTLRYELAFWRKLFAPLTNLAALFIALPFILGAPRRASIGERLVLGILLGLSFYLIDRMLGDVVLLYGFPPLVGALLPTALFIAAGSYGLRRLP